MDLSVSPDVDAFYCYGIVVAIGFLTGLRQVSKKLGARRGIWFVWHTWLLFALYFAVPVVLFWVLDRTSAIHDTSLMAAMIVGFGYERILAGGLDGLTAPGTVSRFWTPFLAYADEISKRVNRRIFRNQARFDEWLIKEAAEHQQRFEALKKLTLNRSDDADQLNAELAAIDNQAAAYGADYARDKKSQMLYKAVAKLPDFHFLMKENKIIDRWVYYWYAREWRSRALAIIIALILFTLLSGTALRVNRPELMVQYSLWRLEKQNSSQVDQFRAANHLSEYLHDPATAEQAFAGLADSLLKPRSVADRVNRILQILLEHRSLETAAAINLPILLTAALRCENVDTRARIHRALLFIAEEQSSESPSDSLLSDLRDWGPSEGDSVTDLERRINEWSAFWRQVQQPE